ncbi:membrane-bound metal-dependent hydrolase [Candidatus Nitrosoglobus terrae]|uniref:Membrane-bound metal-dependent hydrolase n=1 Tax=Candidatus Nitrosoglobus terrae TaxID=1630141 RepID=A0A1Q2SKA7_9GAMM|nr:metal-dependent hydrolase [Candidatus Nitrosoglobus terrae]BAW79550.1 membrane-bound metal-dependent hydrolase [Candidatus Nitrosoglobus terrae]
MANFNIHMLGAAAVSGIGVTTLLITRAFPPSMLMAYFILGILGGMLPDIDSKSSIAIRWVFSVLGVGIGFFLVLYFGTHYSLIELVILWGTCFIIVRYGVSSLLTKLTVHRGLIHSIPAGLSFSLGAVILAVQIFGISLLNAWLCGLFLFSGFITHLVLDELYSVDLRGIRVKKSFGSALSLGSFRTPFGTLLLYLLTGILVYLAPPIDKFLAFIYSSKLHQLLLKRLLPAEDWFHHLVTAIHRFLLP